MSHKRVRGNASTHNAADRILAFVVIVIECRNQHLQRCPSVYGGGRDGIDDGLEEWFKVTSLVIGMVHGDPIAPDCVKNWKIEMGIGRGQFQEQVLRPFHYLLDAGITAIDFVNDDDRL